MAATVQELDTAIARWNTRLKRAVNTIDKLQKRRKRLVIKAERDLAIAPPGATKPKPKPTPEPMPPHEPEPMPSPVDIDTTVPDFLRRDKDAAEQIRQEQADKARRKATGRIARMKAKQSGETRKMPLTGRAALAAIRQG
jgi:hypothetical protein